MLNCLAKLLKYRVEIKKIQQTSSKTVFTVLKIVKKSLDGKEKRNKQLITSNRVLAPQWRVHQCNYFNQIDLLVELKDVSQENQDDPLPKNTRKSYN